MPELARDVLLLGTDEAGYGPNLGPLLVGASGWLVENVALPDVALDAFALPSTPPTQTPPPPPKPRKTSKKRRLALDATPTFFAAFPGEAGEATTPEPAQAPTSASALPAPFDVCLERFNAGFAPIADAKGVFPILDSKKLYGAGRSLANLERTVLVALALLGLNPATARDALTQIAPADVSNAPDAAPPWERRPFPRLPVDPKSFASSDALAETANAVDAFLRRQDVRLLRLAARRVQADELNRYFATGRLKSDAIAEYTTSLLVETLDAALRQASVPPGVVAPCLALCDKLGGRNDYGEVLARRFPNAAFQIVCETRAVGIYRALVETALDRDGRTLRFPNVVALEIRFTAKGEANRPTALASICAKYFREISMTLFNDFWREATGNPNLAPTAGYPVDALRFRADVEDARRRLAIDDDVFWRSK